MNERNRFPLTLAAALLAAGATLLLLALLRGPSPVRASPGILCVAPGGTGCDSPCSATCYGSVQAAVDAPGSGDEIRVAAGVYADVHCRDGVTQVVYVSETVTIRGGYTTTNWYTSYPVTQPTTLDAGGQGRVFYIYGTGTAGGISPTLEGLRLTNGASSGRGGGIWGGDAHLTISGCHVFSNTADTDGGGMYIIGCDGATLTDNAVYSNTANDDGGGLFLNGSDGAMLTDNELAANTAESGGGVRIQYSDDATLSSNQVNDNEALFYGGGGYFAYSTNALLADNEVYSNTASNGGGGFYLGDVDGAALAGNTVYSNTANGGGGVFAIWSDDATLTDNEIYSNTAGYGGGIYLQNSDNALLADSDIFENTATNRGGGVYLTGGDNVTVSHNRVFSNTATDPTWSYGGGVYLSSANATLAQNEVFSNTSYYGGGVCLCSSADNAVIGNELFRNTAMAGGALCLQESNGAILAGNKVYRNEAYYGGGIYLLRSYTATLMNNLVVENRLFSDNNGAGVYLHDAMARLLHTTLARNSGGDGQGVYVTGGATLWMTNTILVSHTIGIEAEDSGTAATLAATLWGEGAWANIADVVTTSGGAVITGADVRGDPAFVGADGGDYHITFGSAARDRGVGTEASDDIDGDARPIGDAPDLGADEYGCGVRLDGMYYPTVQAAVTASKHPTDVVQVAGICRGVQAHGPHSETVYINNKTLTIRGGYRGDFSAWRPLAYPTTLDALGQGRAVYITEDCTPTLEALRLTNGAINSLGGGIYAWQAHPVISGCQVYSNTASNGGGIYLTTCDNARLTGNTIYNNTTGGNGGGVFLNKSDNARLVNNIVARNRITSAGGLGAGIAVFSRTVYLLHTTLARNSGGQGPGVYVSGGATVWMTNTILVSHTVGIRAGADCTATLEATLWGAGAWANETPWTGLGYIYTGTVNVWGDPRFMDPNGWDYHLGPGSAAIDQGVSTDVSTDIDGDPRAIGKPDLGADEVRKWVYLPLVLRNHP